MLLELSKIRTDGGTQPRAAIDFTAVEDYSDAMRDGVKFPPVVVFYDGSEYWLADGFHRVKAAFGAERDEIECDVHQGAQADAQWYSFSANKANGLRRTNDDKRRAVKAALAHPKSATLSSNAIAKHVGVSHTLVDEWRKKEQSHLANSARCERTVTRGGTTYQQNTANIGRKPEPKPEPDYGGGTRVERQAPEPQPERTPPPRISIAPPPKPEPPRVNVEAEAVTMLRAIYDLAEHKISATDLVAMTPDGNIADLYQKARAGFEFIGFVFELAGKRQKKSTEVL